MAVNWTPLGSTDLLSVAGFELGTTAAGIRKADRQDLTVIRLIEGSSVAGVFTRNRFCAAPVQVCRQHLAASASPRALVINTGNANAGTGAEGLARAFESCTALAAQLGIEATEVLPFSTGVIMESLPIERLVAGLPAAIEDLAENHWFKAAHAIMTTDTVAKGASVQIEIGGKAVTVTGISKGAGMIHPNMATMLGFVATDAAVDASLLQAMVVEAADASFNSITVDGDTSTNDSFLLVATHQARHAPITALDSPDARRLRQAVVEVSQRLAQAIVRDGEGATKFITVTVQGGKSITESRQAAFAIAHSPLVKTAFFASDPNLGRILAAVGNAGIDDLDANQIDLWLDDVAVVAQGGRLPAYREEDGQRVLKQSEITVRVGLNRGSATATIWTCDLSHDYVTINADYRS